MHGCMIFCANRGLICKMYGESSKNRFYASFQYDPQSAHLHALPNGFRRQSAGGVLWIMHSQLSQTYIYPLLGQCLVERASIEISEAMHGALLNRQRILCPQNCLPQVEELVESFPTRDPGPSRSDGWVDSHARHPCLRPASTVRKGLAHRGGHAVCS